MNNVIVLASGGIDSTTLLADVLASGDRPIALFVDYGQLAALAELEAIGRITAHYDVLLRVGSLPSFHGSGSALLGEAPMPEGAEQGLSDAYVPARNAILLSLAASLASTFDSESVAFGPNATDADNFPDCRPDFVDSMREVLYPVGVYAPFLTLTKRQVVDRARELGAPLDLTVSCYRGTGCGECPACYHRAEALGG